MLPLNIYTKRLLAIRKSPLVKFPNKMPCQKLFNWNYVKLIQNWKYITFVVTPTLLEQKWQKNWKLDSCCTEDRKESVFNRVINAKKMNFWISFVAPSTNVLRDCSEFLVRRGGPFAGGVPVTNKVSEGGVPIFYGVSEGGGAANSLRAQKLTWKSQNAHASWSAL